MNKKSSARGFTLIEVALASLVLAVGLLSAGFMAGQMMVGTNRSKYMSAASALASEKIEDLNRWDVDDPQVCVPTGSTTAGSLTSDVNQTTTCPSGGASENISYYDNVYPNLTNGTSACPGGTAGCFAETVSTVVSGTPTYTTTVHAPSGTVQTSSSTASPTGGGSYHRRWIIEANSPTTGVRRITVLVTLTNNAVTPPVKFQMSIVRP